MTTGKARRTVLAGLAAGAALSGIAAFPAVADDQTEKASLKLSKSFSGVIRAQRDGKVIFDGTFGFADYETRAPMRSDQRFRIGSVSKTFTAELIHILTQASLIAADQTAGEILPEFPNIKDVPVSRLVTHTSGLGDFDQSGWKRLLLSDPASGKDFLPSILNGVPLSASTINKFKYSNAGYVFLGLIVERLTGSSFAQALTELLLAPRGLPETGFAARDSGNSNFASGHGPNRKRDRAPYDYTLVAPAGGLYSTVQDLVRWADGMTLPRAAGWRSGERFGQKAIWHAGNTNDFSALLVRFPEINGTYAVLSNVGRKPPPKEIMRTLPEALFGVR